MPPLLLPRSAPPPTPPTSPAPNHVAATLLLRRRLFSGRIRRPACRRQSCHCPACRPGAARLLRRCCLLLGRPGPGAAMTVRVQAPAPPLCGRRRSSPAGPSCALRLTAMKRRRRTSRGNRSFYRGLCEGTVTPVNSAEKGRFADV